jgi:hypothetical protein
MRIGTGLEGKKVIKERYSNGKLVYKLSRLS